MPKSREHRSTAFWIALLVLLWASGVGAQSFGTSTLDFGGLGGVSAGTALAFGPDGRLDVMQVVGTLAVFAMQRVGADD
jgi:hypothetical protein